MFASRLQRIRSISFSLSGSLWARPTNWSTRSSTISMSQITNCKRHPLRSSSFHQLPHLTRPKEAVREATHLLGARVEKSIWAALYHQKRVEVSLITTRVGTTNREHSMEIQHKIVLLWLRLLRTVSFHPRAGKEWAQAQTLLQTLQTHRLAKRPCPSTRTLQRPIRPHFTPW